MEVILLESIKRLGGLGQTVKVKNGFARNFLVPQGKAVYATAANIKMFEARRAELEKAEAQKLAEAQKRADALSALTLSIEAAVSDEGKLYGSIGPHELEKAIVEKGIEIHSSEINMPEGVIRFIGEYEVNCVLYRDVEATLRVEILANTQG